MERRVCKRRRRVHCTKPNTVVSDLFARKYVHHLVPALMMIDTKGENQACIEKLVRHQVDMALALAAGGFAWSCALKDKLQERGSNPGSLEKQKVVSEDEELVVNQVSEKQLDYGDEQEEEEEEEKIVSERLIRSVRSVLPGGDEIEGVDALLGELGGYIMCLQSQVNVLSRLILEQQY